MKISIPPPSPALAAQMRSAVAALEQGDFATAEPLFEALTRKWPQFADGWHFYGLLLHRKGEPERALELLERALKLDPDNLVFLLNSGRALAEAGRTEAALDCFNHAHELEPDHAQTLVAMAQVMLSFQRGGELIAELERHLPRAGSDWHLWMLLGRCRDQGGEREGAIAAFREATRLAPAGEANPLILLGETARKKDDKLLAEQSFRAALARDPRAAGALLGLGHLASQAGDFELAERHLRAALALESDQHSAWEALSVISSGAAATALIPELDAAIATATPADPMAWMLHFARGRVRERSGDYDGAFDDYVAGNRPRVAGHAYSREFQVVYARNILDYLDRDFVARRIAAVSPRPRPIFVCGMYRSGTTLLETILAAHPEVGAGGEMRYLHDRLLRTLGNSGMNGTGSWLAARSDAELGELARDWQQALVEPAAGSPWLTDKMPGNYALLGLIHVCFPDAPIIHIRRDPRDNCFSCFATPFAEGYLFSSTLESTGHFYRLYECFMAHWRELLGPERIIEVEYEKLVAEPEAEIRRILEAVGLPWDARCLEFHRHARDVRTASVFQVRQPLNASSIGRWRHFAEHLVPLMKELEGPPPL